VDWAFSTYNAMASLIDPEQISEKVGINQQRISQITNNTSSGNIGNLYSFQEPFDITNPGISSIISIF
jgi:transcriptional regulator with XRE-family HTH domain